MKLKVQVSFELKDPAGGAAVEITPSQEALLSSRFFELARGCAEALMDEGVVGDGRVEFVAAETDGAPVERQPLFSYDGKVYIRPVGRGIVLRELGDGGTYLDDVVRDGDYGMRVEIFDVATEAEERKEDAHG